MILRAIALLFLKLTRMSAPDPDVPQIPKAIIIGAPHTSNWDFVYFLALKWKYGVQVNFIGKHTLFKGVMGWFMRSVGGIPVDRRSSNNVVDQMAERFANSERMLLVMAPSGTRSKRDYWKSGFYHIAKAAGVPVYTGYLDFDKRVISFGIPIEITGDVTADMDKFREFYADKIGKRPEKHSRIRLRAEDAEEES